MNMRAAQRRCFHDLTVHDVSKVWSPRPQLHTSRRRLSMGNGKVHAECAIWWRVRSVCVLYIDILLKVAQVHVLPVAAVVRERLPVATNQRAAAHTPHVEIRENPAKTSHTHTNTCAMPSGNVFVEISYNIISINYREVYSVQRSFSDQIRSLMHRKSAWTSCTRDTRNFREGKPIHKPVVNRRYCRIRVPYIARAYKSIRMGNRDANDY